MKGRCMGEGAKRNRQKWLGMVVRVPARVLPVEGLAKPVQYGKLC